MTTRSTVRAITAAGLVVIGAASLAGCTSTHATTAPSGSAAARSTPGASASAGAGATATADPKPVGTRVDVPCATLAPASTFDVYGRSFTLEQDGKPRSGSPAATVAFQRGRVCVWKDSSDGTTITLGVARLPAAPLTRLKDSLYQDSNSVPTYTVEGYFDTTNGIGRADSFPDPYWVDAESTMFGEPGDAQPLLDAVRTALAAATG